MCFEIVTARSSSDGASAAVAAAAATVAADAVHASRFVMKLCDANDDMLYSPIGATEP